MSLDRSELAALQGAEQLGLETRVHQGDHASLKLWLRMLACTTQVETEIRSRLRRDFGVTLARFDYLAQLYRHHQGLKMRDLSRQLMVTGGNVTGLTDELEREGMVVRENSPTDRRSWLVSLTPKGRSEFARMAQAHEQWLQEMFGGLEPQVIQQLHEHLGQLRLQLMRSAADPDHSDNKSSR